MEKENITKEDGRYLIYYKFKEIKKKGNKQGKTNPQKNKVTTKMSREPSN